MNDNNESNQTDAEALFNSHAADYQRLVADSVSIVGGDAEYYAQRKVGLLERMVDLNGKRVLDFGCGIGILCQHLAKTFPDSIITGLDVSGDSLLIAKDNACKKNLRNITFVQGHEACLPQNLGEFDVIIAACVFHHIDVSQREVWMQRLNAILAPQGSLFLFEHNPWNPLTRKAVRDCQFDDGVVLVTSQSAKAIMRRAGIASVRICHYLFVPPALDSIVGAERFLSWLPIGGQYLAIGRNNSEV